MKPGSRERWLLALRRGAVSTFLLVHLGATVIWVLPACAIRNQTFGAVSTYLMPLGMSQYWGMFAPDPVRDTLTLEAEAVDARGLRYGFAFERVADYPWWRAVPRFRHSKFTANLTIPELEGNRVLAARHVVRQLALPAEAFPVSVSVFLRVKSPPPPGGPPADPMAPTYPHVLGVYTIADRREVSP